MLCGLNHLDSGIVTSLDTDVRGQGNLRQTEGTGVGVVGRAGDLEGRDDRVAHILRDRAETNVDIDQGSLMAREPTRLDRNGASLNGPLGTVG